MPGVQTLLPVMLNHVAQGRMSLERLVDLTSAGAQRVFGVAGKGRMAEGFDGDVTLVDLNHKRVLRHEDMRSRCGWTPFDGLEVTGWPKATIIRGKIVMRDDEIVGPSQGEACKFMESL
jgi:dihydroorotase